MTHCEREDSSYLLLSFQTGWIGLIATFVHTPVILKDESLPNTAFVSVIGHRLLEFRFQRYSALG